MFPILNDDLAPKRTSRSGQTSSPMINRRSFLSVGFSTLALSGCNKNTKARWRKSAANPVLGGGLGTCFDVCVIRVGAVYRMYFSWRPRRSIALVESHDGVHWTAPDNGSANTPEIVLRPNPASSWEDDINRPIVLQREDGFHMWY